MTAEKFREVSERTRVSIPMTVLLTVIGTTGGVVGAGYAARDQAVDRINTAIQASATTERSRSDERYMTRLEFVERVAPRLTRMETKLDQVLERRR